jgi:acyl-CoA synthetase (AMP-forming)/AMP-acid ligase II
LKLIMVDIQELGVPRTIDQLLRHRAETKPDGAVLSYPSVGINYVNYTPRELDYYAFRVAKLLAPSLPTRASSAEKPSVVALLGVSDMPYIITHLALAKLGHSVLFLSTRISKEAYVSLLNTTESSNIVISSSFTSLANELQEALPKLQVHGIPQEEEFYYPIETLHETKLFSPTDISKEENHVCFIVHSSGSTGIPKPVYQTHKKALFNYASNMGMRGFVCLPLFHSYGLANTWRALYSCKQIHLYNASLPLTNAFLTNIMSTFDFEVFYSVPYALKLLAETEEGISLLRKFKAVLFGGAACPDSVGDKLVANGVNLVAHYGTYVVPQSHRIELN